MVTAVTAVINDIKIKLKYWIKSNHLVWVDENVNSRGESEQQVTELDHDPAPQWLVGKLPVAGNIDGELLWWYFEAIMKYDDPSP